MMQFLKTTLSTADVQYVVYIQQNPPESSRVATIESRMAASINKEYLGEAPFSTKLFQRDFP